MGKVKEETYEKLVEMYYDSKTQFVKKWNQFIEEYDNNPETLTNISGYIPNFGELEARINAFAEVAIAIFDDDSLMKDYEELTREMCVKALELLENK